VFVIEHPGSASLSRHVRPLHITHNLDIIGNESAFDKRQLALIREIVRAIKSDLADSGIPEERLADVTGGVAFSIAAIIDGIRVMQADGQPLIPVLAFAEDSERMKFVGRPGGSFMHEYVYGTVDDIFDEDVAKPDAGANRRWRGPCRYRGSRRESAFFVLLQTESARL